jgi:hypothetical protein
MMATIYWVGTRGSLVPKLYLGTSPASCEVLLRAGGGNEVAGAIAFPSATWERGTVCSDAHAECVDGHRPPLQPEGNK